MPNIAAILKSESSRIARKEVRAGFDALKKHNTEQHSRIAELWRQVGTLTKECWRRPKRTKL